MQLCDYSCGQESKHQLKNGKWCCCKNIASCLKIRKKISEMKMGKKREPFSEEWKRNLGKSKKGKKLPPFTEEHLKNMSISLKGKNTDPKSEKTKRKMSEAKKGINYIGKGKDNPAYLTIKKINKKYIFFSKIEETRYNPEKPKEKEIQVHCKNHKCENSKEKDGWFTPTRSQLYERIQVIENPRGFGESNFYCSQECKDTCILHGLRGDPCRDNNKSYTHQELAIFNKHILKRDNEICYYCGEHTATIVHHLRPQKLEPFFALDPDYAVSCCGKCHYKHGHPTGSEHSTGNLAKIVCSVESQKFLNQK